MQTSDPSSTHYTETTRVSTLLMCFTLSLSSCVLKRGSYVRVVMATTSSTPLTYRTPTRCTPHHHHLTNTHSLSQKRSQTHTRTHTRNPHTHTVLNSARCAVPSTTSHVSQRRETVRNVFESAREKRHLSQAKQLIINQITHTHTHTHSETFRIKLFPLYIS